MGDEPDNDFGIFEHRFSDTTEFNAATPCCLVRCISGGPCVACETFNGYFVAESGREMSREISSVMMEVDATLDNRSCSFSVN